MVIIHTTVIQNILINRIDEFYFIFINSGDISIEFLTIMNLTDIN